MITASPYVIEHTISINEDENIQYLRRFRIKRKKIKTCEGLAFVRSKTGERLVIELRKKGWPSSNIEHLFQEVWLCEGDLGNNLRLKKKSIPK